MEEINSDDINFVKQSASSLGLKIKIVKAEFIGEDTNKKFFVYFSAPHRVDFRGLIKVLAKQYHCRIEMRQITPRQHAAILGGISLCGKIPCFRPFCHKNKWGGCFYDKEETGCGECSTTKEESNV